MNGFTRIKKIRENPFYPSHSRFLSQALLQGFPSHFTASSRANYNHHHVHLSERKHGLEVGGNND